MCRTAYSSRLCIGASTFCHMPDTWNQNSADSAGEVHYKTIATAGCREIPTCMTLGSLACDRVTMCWNSSKGSPSEEQNSLMLCSYKTSTRVRNLQSNSNALVRVVNMPAMRHSHAARCSMLTEQHTLAGKLKCSSPTALEGQPSRAMRMHSSSICTKHLQADFDTALLQIQVGLLNDYLPKGLK